jgi:hypothetical protein
MCYTEVTARNPIYHEHDCTYNFPLSACCVTFQVLLTCVNQPKAVVACGGYHYQHSREQNV